MKVTALVFSAMVASGAAFGIEEDKDFPAFQKFMQTYNRVYATQSETQGRFLIFKDNLRLIEERNNDGGMDVHGINHFTDIHPAEFRAKYLGTHINVDANKEKYLKTFNETELVTAPTAIDWRTKGAITPVKNQGQCGSCWAFSTTEQVESDTFLATGKLNVLSPQQIVSCDTVDGGCNGGNPINGYAYVNGAKGLESNANYPYTSGTTQTDGTCSFDAADVVKNTSPTSYSLISSKASQEQNMYTQILSSPMSVCVDATIWQTYQSGIITAADNCGTSIDHAVQAVGIQGGSTPAWIVRNSWTDSWGLEGYILVATGANNCGITAEATITNPN